MSLLSDIASAGYGVARTAGKVGSVSSDVNNILNGRVDKVVKKNMKRMAFGDVNRALNAGAKMFRI